MLIDAHVHIFPKVDGYGPKGHTHGAGYGRIDAGDGIGTGCTAGDQRKHQPYIADVAA